MIEIARHCLVIKFKYDSKWQREQRGCSKFLILLTGTGTVQVQVVNIVLDISVNTEQFR
jgi:hypothetical protein